MTMWGWFSSNKPTEKSLIMEPGCQSCRRSRRLVGDPIDVVTGANADVTIDFELAGPTPLRWRRYYISARNAVSCPLGWGHSHEFDRTLIRDLDGLRYKDPFGAAIEFPPLDVEEEIASNGLLLRRLTASGYEIEASGEPTMEFEFTGSAEAALLQRLRQGKQTIELRYGASGRLREIIDSRGRLIRVATDHAGRVVGLFLAEPHVCGKERPLMEYRYDRVGNLVTGQDLSRATLSFRYDQHNRMTCRTDRRGYSFHYEYDDQGRCVHSRGDDGLLEVWLEYHADLKTTFVRRADGGVRTYFYDDLGSLTRIIDSYGGTTRFVYDEKGRTVEEIDPNGNVTKLLYDELGQHERRIDPLGYELPPYEDDPEPDDPLAYMLPETPLEWEYGRLLFPHWIERLRRDDRLLQGVPAEISDALMESATTLDGGDVNADPGPTSVKDGPAPAVVLIGRVEAGEAVRTGRRRYDANGNLIEYQDRDGSVYRYGYTSWSLLHKEINPAGGATTYEYSTSALLTRLTDPGGTVSEYAYDQKDRLVEVRRHGRVRERYRYDKAENIVAKEDGQGQTLVTWEIGPGNLDVARHLASGETHTFECDQHGRVTMAATPDGAITCAYDVDGYLVKDQRDGLGVVHEFDLGRLAATTYFGKFRVVYKRDENGDLVITDPTGSSHRVQVTAGGLITRVLSNGTREICQYDTAGRCRRKAVLHGLHDASPWLHSYTYSTEGDLLAVTDTHRGTTRYRHDSAHRLVEAILPDGSRSRFEYDAAGNLVRQPGLTEVQMDSGNRLRAANGDRFSYDDRDHVSTRQGPSGTIRYEYNVLGMLVCCEIDGQPWKACYDGYGRRISKTWQGCTTTFYWDNFRLAAELMNYGVVRLYLYTDEVALSPFMFVEYPSLDAEPRSGQRYFVFSNQVSAPIRVENGAGRAVWTARIDPYGHALVNPGSTLELSLRFPGHYHDAETGLHDNRFRAYSPELGRYLQSDPLGTRGGINLYAYSHEPLTEVDLDGLRVRARSNARATGPKGECPHENGMPCLKTIVTKRRKGENARDTAERVSREMVKDRTERGIPHHELPSVVTVVRDKRTGKVYIAESGRPVLHPEHVSNPDQLNMPSKSRAKWPEPGRCGEPKAINAALADGSRKRDLEVATVRVRPSGEGDTGTPVACCPNCRQTTKKTNVLTG
jgi:RHS repeat-associated protein